MKKLSVLLLAATFLFACKKGETATENTPALEPVAQNEPIANVFSNANLEKQVFAVDGNKDAVVKGKNGTMLKIAKNTFVDADGKPIKGKVDVELKEAITRADIVLAGLTTTSNGHLLESGGMVYVNATADGQPVKIASQKSIEVKVPAKKLEEGMLIFKGEQDAETGIVNWVDPQDIIKDSKDAVANTFVKGSESDLDFTETYRRGDTLIYQTKGITKPVVPVKPAKATENDDRIISIKFEDPDDFPELKKFQNVKFRLADDADYNPNDTKRQWASVDIKKAQEQGYYTLTFTGYDKGKKLEKKYNVVPALNGKDLEVAMAEYNAKMKEYEEERKLYEERRRQEELERKQRREQRVAQVEDNLKTTGDLSDYVYNIKEFGWSNIDRFYKEQDLQDVELFASSKNNYGDAPVTVSLVLAKRNVFLKGYLAKNGRFVNESRIPLKLPLNEPTLLLATSYFNGKPHYSIQQFNTASKVNLALQLKQATAEELKAAVKDKIGA